MAHRIERKRTSSPLVSRFVDVGNIFERWQEIGENHGLRTNQEIATFLVQCYEDIWSGKQSPHCYQCRHPVSFVCEKCGWSKSNSDDPTENCDDGLKKDLVALVDSFNRGEDETEDKVRSSQSGARSGQTNRVNVRPAKRKFQSDGIGSDEDDIPVTMAPRLGLPPPNKDDSQFVSGEIFTGKACLGFTDASHLMDHSQACFRKFGCLECGITFASASHLIVHVRKKHPHKETSKKTAADKNGEKTVENVVAKLKGRCGQKAAGKATDKRVAKGAEKAANPSLHAANVAAVGSSGCVRKGNSKDTGRGRKLVEKAEKADEASAAFPPSSTSFPPDACLEESAVTAAKDVFDQVKEELDDETMEDTVEITDEPARPAPHHPKPKRHQCPACGQQFSHSGHLTVHLRIHSGDKPYKCELCSATFVCMSGLTKHSRTHTGDKPFQCDTCEAKFMYSGQLKVHIRKHTGERPFKCPYCDSSFTQSSSLNHHLKNHTGEKNHICPNCPARFTKSTYLVAHIRVHTGEKPFKCKVCGTAFKHDSALFSHMRIHTGAKPFLCSECGRAFAHSSNLKKHMLTHSGKRPYVCTQCDKSFIDPSNMKRHVRTQHSGIRPFKCDQCLKAFGTSDALKVHMRTHSGGKPFKCEECPKEFTTLQSLNNHKNVHTAKRRPFPNPSSSAAAPLPTEVPMPLLNAAPGVWSSMDPNLGPNSGVPSNYQGFPLMWY